MKLTIFILTFLLSTSCRQSNSEQKTTIFSDKNTINNTQTENPDISSNSFENIYHKSNPSLKYSYDYASQTHNYSNNWDFDKDGKNDEVYFIGLGGAHLYYFLKVVLTTDNKPREFDFIQSDLPILTATDTLNYKKDIRGFIVTDLGENLTPTIVIKLDEQIFYNNKQLKKRKIKTENVLISFENGKTKYGCL